MFKTFVRKMSRVNINFKLKGRQVDDPATIPCLIVGLGRNINKLGFEDVKHKLKDKVSEEVLFTIKVNVNKKCSILTEVYYLITRFTRLCRPGMQ